MPSLRSRCSTATQGSSAASRSAISPVPSGEPSSMTSTRSRAVSSTAAERPHHRLEVLPLVVRREADDGARHRPYHRGMAKALPRNAELADQLDLLADLSEILGEQSFKVIAYRRAATRIRETPSPGRRACARGEGEGASRDRQDDRAEDRRGRRGRARWRRSRSGARQVPGGRRRLPAAPGCRAEDGRADLDAARRDDARRASRRPRRTGGCASSPGMGAAERGEDPEGARGGRRRATRDAAAAARHGTPGRARVVEALAAHPAAIAVSEAGSVRRRRETFRDLDVIATSSDAPALIAASATGDWVPRSSRAATRRRPSSATRAFASTCASCRPSATATSSSTSRARRTTTSRCARTRSGAGSRSRSTASRSSRRARS